MPCEQDNAAAEYVQVVTTTDAIEIVERIADTALAAGLAACIQVVGPITSHFVWQGRRERATEWLCLLKARRGAFRALEAAIRSVHNYDTPEILALPLVEGNADYLDWMRRQTQGPLPEPAGEEE